MTSVRTVRDAAWSHMTAVASLPTFDRGTSHVRGVIPPPLTRRQREAFAHRSPGALLWEAVMREGERR